MPFQPAIQVNRPLFNVNWLIVITRRIRSALEEVLHPFLFLCSQNLIALTSSDAAVAAATPYDGVLMVASRFLNSCFHANSIRLKPFCPRKPNRQKRQGGAKKGKHRLHTLQQVLK